jgi:chaperonin GroES
MTSAAQIPADFKIPPFVPLADRVVIQPDKAPTHVGNIIIPDSMKEEPQEGRVVAIGPGMLCRDGSRWPMPDLQIGDRLLYGPRQGTIAFKVGEIWYLSMRQEHCLLVIDPVDGGGVEISSKKGSS